MEDEADRFASEFLMPEADIRHELSGLTLQMSKLGFRTREPEETAIEPDRPRLVSELIDFHLSELSTRHWNSRAPSA